MTLAVSAAPSAPTFALAGASASFRRSMSGLGRKSHLAALLGCVALVAAAGCSHLSLVPSTPPRSHIHALLLNGGGRPEVNYQSHLQNVRSLVELLHLSGVPSSDITIFSGDGADPAADLATRELGRHSRTTGCCRSGLGRFLRPPTRTSTRRSPASPCGPPQGRAARMVYEQGRALRRRRHAALLRHRSRRGEQEGPRPTTRIMLWEDDG